MRFGPGQFRMPVSNCLACGYRLDAATNVTDGGRPKSGDITVCLSCGHIMAFRGNLTVRELTDKEMIDIAGNPLIVRLQTLRQRFVPNGRN